MNATAAPQATATPAAQIGPRLVDEVSMVHNALQAVRSLVIPTGTGYTASGYPEALDLLSRTHFGDLLEILNDRLAIALETHESRRVN